MKSLILAFYFIGNSVTYSTAHMPSEFACQAVVQEIEDGSTVVLTYDNGTESPPLILAICIDPQRGPLP